MDDHLVLGTGNPEPLLNGREGTLQLCVLERNHRTAVLAGEVMVMLTRGRHHFKRRNSGDLHAPHQPMAAQQLQRPVHACHPDPAAALAQAIVDFLRTEQTVLIGEKLHHLIARTASPRP